MAVDGEMPTTVVGYMLFKTLGDLLPAHYDETVRLACDETA